MSGFFDNTVVEFCGLLYGPYSQRDAEVMVEWFDSQLVGLTHDKAKLRQLEWIKPE